MKKIKIFTLLIIFLLSMIRIIFPICNKLIIEKIQFNYVSEALLLFLFLYIPFINYSDSDKPFNKILLISVLQPV